MTQTDRVLAALSRAGARGITRVDFQLPHVIDGGDPILNIPGRIYDLKRDGIEIDKVGQRDSCDVYVLRPAETTSAAGGLREPEPDRLDTSASSPAGELEIDQHPERDVLFHIEPRNAIFDEEAA